MAKKIGSADLVRVACKLPQGLHIELKTGDVIKLHGSQSPYAVANHGMTDITAAKWEQIQAEYAEAKWLTNEAVFAHAKAEDAAAEATERRAENIGFNPIDPNKPNAVPGIGAKITPDGVADTGTN